MFPLDGLVLRLLVGARIHRDGINEQRAFEMLRWFDKYVKNALPRTVGKYATGGLKKSGRSWGRAAAGCCRSAGGQMGGQRPYVTRGMLIPAKMATDQAVAPGPKVSSKARSLSLEFSSSVQPQRSHTRRIMLNPRMRSALRPPFAPGAAAASPFC